MSRIKFRIACCLCRKPIPASSDAYALDREWQRRFPNMVGTLACGTCTLKEHYWDCVVRYQGHVAQYEDGHIPADKPNDTDSLCHIRENGTHVAMVITHPRDGLLQGAEEYLRDAARGKYFGPQVTQRITAALTDWDTQQPVTHRRLDPTSTPPK